ncbi:2Fe-2S iron-sulfur cluster-binding protein [Mesorhizobium sp.]|uniref:flavin reductase family protein n=1 Tax=Mesorhizobium sp. TaxID=1871066 RepID=UPI0025C4F713|nr:2Fe-2S iron-sulfur cluster-binding protein [Mesorhizobium sp.]
MAVVAGSGITPIISIVKTVLTRERESRVLLLCGNRRWKDILFRDELADLERSFPERFVLRHFLSRESDDGDFVKGRIDGDAVEATLTRLDVPVSSIDHALLCGPVDMVKTINDRLLWCGITSDKIAYELFEATTGPAVSPQSNDGNEAIVEIVLDSESRVFQATSMDTIVGAALRAGVDVPYSCGSGTCCSCLAKLVHGEVHQRSNSALQPSEIEAGLVLTCQTTAISRRILIDYDAAF